jgi:excinuclease UvrABC helicase subunit UvrB
MAEKITSKLNVRANKEANVAGGMINAGVADSVLKRARQKRAEEAALNDKATKTKPKENPKRVDKMVEMVPAETTTVEAEKQVSLMDKMRSLQRKVFK